MLAYVMCSTSPHLTSLNLNWSELMDMSVTTRNTLYELLTETRDKEIQASRPRH